MVPNWYQDQRHRHAVRDAGGDGYAWSAWGCVVLHRTEATGDFTHEDARLLARLSRPIAEALRSSYRFDAARRSREDRAPGLLMLGAHDEVEVITPPAIALLEQLAREDPAHRTVPAAAIALAADVRNRGRAGRSAPPLHVPTSSGWLTLHGSLPDGDASGRVAIVVQRTGDEYALPLRLEAFGLTPREREVATLVARGLDTAAIAEQRLRGRHLRAADTLPSSRGSGWPGAPRVRKRLTVTTGQRTVSPASRLASTPRWRFRVRAMSYSLNIRLGKVVYRDREALSEYDSQGEVRGGPPWVQRSGRSDDPRMADSYFRPHTHGVRCAAWLRTDRDAGAGPQPSRSTAGRGGRYAARVAGGSRC